MSTTLTERQLQTIRILDSIKEAVSSCCERYIGEPIDSITKNKIKDEISKAMATCTYDYVIICDDSNNPPNAVESKTLHVDIAFKPYATTAFVYVTNKLILNETDTEHKVSPPSKVHSYDYAMEILK